MSVKVMHNCTELCLFFASFLPRLPTQNIFDFHFSDGGSNLEPIERWEMLCFVLGKVHCSINYQFVKNKKLYAKKAMNYFPRTPLFCGSPARKSLAHHIYTTHAFTSPGCSSYSGDFSPHLYWRPSVNCW